jgi:hypothetical protein
MSTNEAFVNLVRLIARADSQVGEINTSRAKKAKLESYVVKMDELLGKERETEWEGMDALCPFFLFFLFSSFFSFSFSGDDSVR